MSETTPDFNDGTWLPREFFENQRNFPPERLEPYRGQYVAWSWQGDRVVAHAASREALHQALRDAGLDSQRVVFDYVEDL